MISNPSLWKEGLPNYVQFLRKTIVKQGCNEEAGTGDFPWILSQENRRKIETKEIPSCLISPLLVVFTRQLEILVTTLAFLCVLNFKNLFSFHSHSSDKPTVPDKNTAVVGTLEVNTVFFPCCAVLFRPNAVYCDSVTKSCTPTLGGRKDTTVSLQF